MNHPASSQRLQGVLKALGPGILMAGAAVGGSHLVSSTQAGALFGWHILGILFLVNLSKYPFFLYGTRYTAATGETILHGYRRLGRGYLGAFFVLNLANAVLNVSGVAFITAAIALGFGIDQWIGDKALAAAIAVLCALIVVVGHYRLLDRTAKVVMFILSVSTCLAVLMTALGGPAGDPSATALSPWDLASIGIVIQFMGWMPAPIDIAAWPSLWMASRERETSHRATMREAMIDFHVGYVGTVVLAVFFVALGTLVMFGTGEGFADSGLQFSRRFIGMYAESIGEWSRPVILVAAFTTMFSTTLTCVDGYPRALAMCTAIATGREGRFRALHVGWVLLTVAIAVVVVLRFTATMGDLIFVAMVVSFSTSPVMAWINLRAMEAPWVPEEFRPGRILRPLQWFGLVFLTLTTLVFLYWLLFLR